tara:strand:- start:7660 stop:7869 length:210 start_codon:yes stop_codon:yes gene_type:complete
MSNKIKEKEALEQQLKVWDSIIHHLRANCGRTTTPESDTQLMTVIAQYGVLCYNEAFYKFKQDSEDKPK